MQVVVCKLLEIIYLAEREPIYSDFDSGGGNNDCNLLLVTLYNFDYLYGCHCVYLFSTLQIYIVQISDLYYLKAREKVKRLFIKCSKMI